MRRLARFLLQACVLRQFTPELCDAVLGRADSEAVLARLASANPFVSRLERGGAYRVHSLFAEFAAYQLRALDPDAAADIHRRASRWFRSRRMCAEAVEHAAAAGDLELVADILADHYLQLIRTGQSHALRQWMQLLDDEQIVSHPVLAVGGATAAMVLGGEGFERRHYLDLVRRTEVEYPERMTPYVRSTAAMVSAAAVDRDVGRAVEAGREAVAFARMDAESDASLVAALGSLLARALPRRRRRRRLGDCAGGGRASGHRAPAAGVRASRAPHSRWPRSIAAGFLPPAHTRSGRSRSSTISD